MAEKLNQQVLIKLQQNWSKQEARECVLKSTDLLIPFGIRKKFQEYFIVLIYKSVARLTVVIIKGYQCYQPYTKSYPIFLSQG
jgi:hypothetical protein